MKIAKCKFLIIKGTSNNPKFVTPAPIYIGINSGGSPVVSKLMDSCPGFPRLRREASAEASFRRNDIFRGCH
jgi:hypothetical protein